MKLLFRLPLLLMLLASVLTSCDAIGQRVTGNGDVVKQNISVGSFNSIALLGSTDAIVTKGNTVSVVVEGESNIIPLLEIKVEGGELKIGTKRGVSYNTHKDIKVYITTPNLEGVSLTGSGDMIVKDEFTSNSNVTVKLTGSGNLNAKFKAPNVKAVLTGSGDLVVGGSTKNVDISISGSGDVNAKNLLSENADVQISGSGDVDCHASVGLNVRISGSGDVKYSGSPSVNTKVSGSGSVRKS
ncbi:putative autotransporter adhesin-like protein [Chitinophaga skermanii]|uniref:Putative autotransporter adhesin-like protein n=1 Tax=Chitinophaga skermanii TaxID=331697 RepID=A0A327RAS6_9BACT|nr:head GIN domain-containing protein [Chitinophaga skermanii]RAJ11027.1 putative autotransporter adhesin-like protein [Chitinophaga skermanii]